MLRITSSFWHITNPVTSFLADRTNGRAYATGFCLSVRPSVTLCIVAKRCVLEQKLLLRAYITLHYIEIFNVA